MHPVLFHVRAAPAAAGSPAGMPHRRKKPGSPFLEQQGGFTMDIRTYIFAIVAAIVLLAVNIIRDYGRKE